MECNRRMTDCRKEQEQHTFNRPTAVPVPTPKATDMTTCMCVCVCVSCVGVLCMRVSRGCRADTCTCPNVHKTHMHDKHQHLPLGQAAMSQLFDSNGKGKERRLRQRRTESQDPGKDTRQPHAGFPREQRRAGHFGDFGEGSCRGCQSSSDAYTPKVCTVHILVCMCAKRVASAETWEVGTHDRPQLGQATS